MPARGYEGTTIRGIATDAGVDPALVHHFFGSKDDLFAATLEIPRELTQRVSAALVGDADGLGDSEPQTLSHPCPCCGGRMIIVETFERGNAPRYRPIVPSRIDSS